MEKHKDEIIKEMDIGEFVENDEFVFDEFSNESDNFTVDNSDKLVDADSGKVINPDDIKPFDVLKMVAEKHNMKLNDPNPNCKK